MHVTLRAVAAIRCLRSNRAFPAVRHALAVSSRADFRIVEFSVQDDHVHLIAEADHARALASGIRGLVIRLAHAVNRALRRRGRVWDDRYHARALTTPREVHNAIAYVLRNRQKHCAGERGLDPCSSALWFDGWREAVATVAAAAPVVRARTWLAAVGWRRHGLLGIDERPRGRRGRIGQLQRGELDLPGLTPERAVDAHAGTRGEVTSRRAEGY